MKVTSPIERTSLSGGWGLETGSHTVQAYFMSYKGVSVVNFTSSYRVYRHVTRPAENMRCLQGQ